MRKLQSVILEKGIENVRIQFIGNASFTETVDAICRLEAYPGSEDFTAVYIHKITVIEVKKTMTKILWVPINNSKNFYMSDLEAMINAGYVVIMSNDDLL